MTVTHRKHFVFWGVSLLWLARSATVFAGNTQEDAARAAARTAGYEGIRAFESGDMAGAVDKLERAFNVVKVPTLGLWYARALAKTGNLVEASERYGEVMRLEVTEGKLKEQKKAQAEAAEELEALQHKIPALTLIVRSASEDCEVTVDGNSVPMQLIGLATPINPGTHRIQAKQGRQLVEQSVTINEGEKKSIELKMEPPAKAGTQVRQSPSADGAPIAQKAPTQATTAPARSGSKGLNQEAIGWISLGLGGVATATGVVTGILGYSKLKQLDDSSYCIGSTCDSRAHGMLTSYKQLRSISTVGFIVGAVGIGAGATLLLTAPQPKEASAMAWLGVGSVGVGGNF